MTKPIKKMPERTYGWYPSVRDIYLSKNQPTPYHLECLYKFKDSGYHNPIVEPPEPAFIIRGITPTPTPPPSRPATSRPISGRASVGRSGRSKSVPVPKFRPVPKLNIPTPLQVWKRAPAETSWGIDTPDGKADASEKPDQPDQEEQTEKKPEVQWPTQQIVGKYDKPFVLSSTAEEVFGTPLPPRDPGAGGDSGYVFVPTGDGGVEVHSPPPIHWPDSYPRVPTPQHSVSSKASIGSADGITARKKLQEEYHQQALKEKEEKKKQIERQRRFDNMLRQQQYQQKKQQHPHPPGSDPGTARGNQTLRRERIQSATTRRDKTPVPKRPVYSARPSRPASDTALYTNRSYQDRVVDAHRDKMATLVDEDEEVVYRAWEDDNGLVTSHQRPINPLPPTPSLEDLVIEEDRSPSPDYQHTVDKYGWRAEVHGDPYNIKKTTKRLPYTVKCEEPVVPPEPHSVHMESKETFFLNTIPRRLATFDVHQDWLSEGLCAQRMELQKRNGVNYRYKNFAFAY